MSEQEFPVQGSLSLQPIEKLEHPLMSKDRWHGEKDLKMRVNKHLRGSTIYFGNISQDWIKIKAKKFILYSQSQGKSFGTLGVYTKGINSFSKFIESKAVYSFDDINDEILSQYYLSLQSFSLKTKTSRLTSIKAFFIPGSINNWFEVSTYWFQGRMPKVKPKNIDYIPEKVLIQLDKHLNLLPEQLQRLVILIRILGLRACEILQMRFDCLKQRKNSQWELHFTNWKFHEREDILPILPEIAEIIKQQQTYIRNQVGEGHEYLFSVYLPGGKSLSGKILTLGSFSNRLNRLAKKKNVCDKNGNLWRFKSHQFRRTVATKMTVEKTVNYDILSRCINCLINSECIEDDNGKLWHFTNRQLRDTRLTYLFETGHEFTVVSKWAGHKKFETTQKYVHVKDHTLRAETASIQAALLNIRGEPLNPKDLPETLQTNPNAHTLAIPDDHINTPIYGYCGLSLDQDCPHWKACYTCPSFVAHRELLPDYIKVRDLLRDKQARAEEKGETALIDQLKQQADSLDTVIASFERVA